jgi:hypothetical protein
MRRWQLKINFSRMLIVAALVLLVTVAGYAAWVRSSAQALISSASEIHSASDAEREIATWRNRSGASFWQEKSTTNGEQTYDIHVENGLLHKLRIVPPTMVGMTISIHDGKLRFIILTVFSGWNPSTTSGVWVQEWFDAGAANSFHVNDNGRPWKATVDFSSEIPQGQRQKALSLNSKCLVRPSGCRSAEEILPGVWQLGPPVSALIQPQ